jgi:pimeloyl-ACP methyl ester carboxylesterase
LPDEFLSTYTVLAIDLPFHGQTIWQRTEFSAGDLCDIITTVLQYEPKKEYALLGYSFGARLALSVLPLLKPGPAFLYLFSPEGIRTKGMSAALSVPVGLRRWLYGAARRPGWIIQLALWGEKMRLIPPFYRHFLQKNLCDAQAVRRSFGCWISLRHFRLNAALIQKNLRKHPVPTEVWVGRKDPLLDADALSRCFSGLPGVNIRWTEKGHRVW